MESKDEIHNFVRDTLVRYGRMNKGMPAFTGITDRRAYQPGEEPGPTPLLRTQNIERVGASKITEDMGVYDDGNERAQTLLRDIILRRS